MSVVSLAELKTADEGDFENRSIHVHGVLTRLDGEWDTAKRYGVGIENFPNDSQCKERTRVLSESSLG